MLGIAGMTACIDTCPFGDCTPEAALSMRLPSSGRYGYRFTPGFQRCAIPLRFGSPGFAVHGKSAQWDQRPLDVGLYPLRPALRPFGDSVAMLRCSQNGRESF